MQLLRTFTVLVMMWLVAFLVGWNLACTHKPVQTQVPSPPAPPRIEMVQYKECTLQGKVATCECTPVNTKINSKTGQTSVVCHLHVR